MKEYMVSMFHNKITKSANFMLINHHKAHYNMLSVLELLLLAKKLRRFQFVLGIMDNGFKSTSLL